MSEDNEAAYAAHANAVAGTTGLSATDAFFTAHQALSTLAVANQLTDEGAAPDAVSGLIFATAQTAPAGTPRTATIRLPGSTTNITGVRMLGVASFGIGDTVAVLKQDTLLVILDKVG